MFGVILGTGCGGGITMLKNIHRGANRIAGEWGHHCLHPDGRKCYCGNRGCIEAYISGTALEKEWYELTGEKHRVTDIIDTGIHEKHPEWKANFLKNFGRGLANVIDILDPHAIVWVVDYLRSIFYIQRAEILYIKRHSVKLCAHLF